MKALFFSMLIGLIAVLSVNSYVSSNSSESLAADDSVKTCPVSKETISGEGVKYKYLGEEVVFCCNGCIKSFKKNPAKYISGGVKDPVCGMSDSKVELNAVYNGVKYYFCNESCKEKFENDPKEYLKEYSK